MPRARSGTLMTKTRNQVLLIPGKLQYTTYIVQYYRTYRTFLRSFSCPGARRAPGHWARFSKGEARGEAREACPAKGMPRATCPQP